jgi:uncharacterized protein (DUF1330 family)
LKEEILLVGYIVADVEITDPEEFDTYRQRVRATMEQYGGKFLTSGVSSHPETLEGNWKTKILTIIVFPSVEQAKLWYNSPEYAAIKSIRQRASISSLLLVHGVEGM